MKRCTSDYTIRLDRPIGRGMESLVVEACSPSEIKNNIKKCGTVAKIQYASSAPRDMDWARSRYILQEKMAKKGLSPHVRDFFVCDTPLSASLYGNSTPSDVKDRRFFKDDEEAYSFAVMDRAKGISLGELLSNDQKIPCEPLLEAFF